MPLPSDISPDLRTQMGTFQRALGRRFVLERTLGRGGMGIVFLAWEPALERPVALKLLPPERALDPVARARFLREARTAARLSHPNIVPIFAVDEIGEYVFFSMPFIAGETLGDRVRFGGALEPREAARLLRDVARALGYAHARGVVHRDVKPDNILLEGPTGRAVVTDFGIARAVTSKVITGPHRVLGTAEFMSPEQARGQPADARSDVYSLGVVAFYALSGRLPFTGSDQVMVLARHATEPAPPLASVAAGVPKALAEIVDRCLLKDPAGRFVNGAALAGVLDGAARGTPGPPLAVRAFLAEGRHLEAPAAAHRLVTGLGLLPLAGAGTVLGWPPVLQAGAWALVGAALAAPAMLALARVRRLVAAGHGRAELVRALRAELARRREELGFVYGRGPGPFERALRRGTFVLLTLCTAAAAAALAHWRPDLPPGEARWELSLVAGALALITALVARARAELRDDARLAARARFWRGAGGRALFRLGEAGRRPERATETSAEVTSSLTA